MMKSEEKKVSVIIPVYNVVLYLDQCLESICTQTYRNLEIVLIDDLSTDGSLQKCRQWEKKDGRIILITNQNHAGLGASRNAGLYAATGEYIVYVDSDDWIDKNYIGILYEAIERTGADYVSSIGFYEVEEGKISRNTFLPAGVYSGDTGKMLVLLKDAPAVWKKIYNRKWLVRMDLFQPELCYVEDWAFDIGLVLQAEKIVLIPEIGVFYRVDREGRLTNDPIESQCASLEKGIAFGLDKARQTGLLDRYRNIILRYILRSYFLRKEEAVSQNSIEALQILERVKSDVLIKQFSCQNVDSHRKHLCFGSFFLRRVVLGTAIYAENLEYFGFSSIISACSRGKEIQAYNQNKFREEQVSKDIRGAFLDEIDAVKEKTVLFLDFLEERYHVLELEDGGYITASETYRDSLVEDIKIKNTVQSGTDVFISLWKERCLAFVEHLELKKDYMDIILIKSRMALQYGDFNRKRTFSNVQELKDQNGMLSGLEDYFLKRCQNKNIFVRTFDLPEQYSFADEQFMYGCEPQYMNGALHTYLGMKIFQEDIKSSTGQGEKQG